MWFGLLLLRGPVHGSHQHVQVRWWDRNRTSIHTSVNWRPCSHGRCPVSKFRSSASCDSDWSSSDSVYRFSTLFWVRKCLYNNNYKSVNYWFCLICSTRSYIYSITPQSLSLARDHRMREPIPPGFMLSAWGFQRVQTNQHLLRNYWLQQRWRLPERLASMLLHISWIRTGEHFFTQRRAKTNISWKRLPFSKQSLRTTPQMVLCNNPSAVSGYILCIV